MSRDEKVKIEVEPAADGGCVHMIMQADRPNRKVKEGPTVHVERVIFTRAQARDLADRLAAAAGGRGFRL